MERGEQQDLEEIGRILKKGATLDEETIRKLMVLRDAIGEDEGRTSSLPGVTLKAGEHDVAVVDNPPATVLITPPPKIDERQPSGEEIEDDSPPTDETMQKILDVLRETNQIRRPPAFSRRRRQHNHKSQMPQPATYGMLGLKIMHRRPIRGM